MIAIIDSGTSTTRVLLSDSGSIVGTGRVRVGAKDVGIAGTTKVLREGIRSALNIAMAEAGAGLDNIEGAAASGMITSEIGLLEVPHVLAPAGASEVAANSRRAKFPDILPVPILFISGVKNRVEQFDVEHMRSVDFMRGEETQVFGLLEVLRPNLPATVIALSSHTKAIGVDEQGCIAGSLTTLSGQIFACAQTQSLLTTSLPQPGERVGPVDDEMALAGFSQARSCGFLRSLLMVRFMDVLMSTTPEQRFWFLEGAIASEDLLALSRAHSMGINHRHKILIGNQERCQLYAYLLRHKFGGQQELTVVDAANVQQATVAGALRVLAEAGKTRT